MNIYNRRKASFGFTITELLVVIVVIGILATVTIVNYVGISKKADDVVLVANLKENKTVLELYKTINGGYPSGVDINNNYLLTPVANNESMNLKLSAGSSLTYISSPPNTSFSLMVIKGASRYIVSNNSAVSKSVALNCPTQMYDDSYGGVATETTNCVDRNNWITISDAIGSEKKDLISGLVWSNLVYKSSPSVVGFSSTNSTDFSWDKTGLNNSINGQQRTAAEICSDRGNGWRIPTQKELMQSYIDGANFVLGQQGHDFWSYTADSDVAKSWAYTTRNGNSFTHWRSWDSSLRCVRPSGDAGIVGTCPNQAYQDNYGVPVTNSTNCILNWINPTDGVAGSEKIDPISGLTWSARIVGIPPAVGFFGTTGFTSPTVTNWKWNVQVSPAKTASQLCSERNNGWRLPTQKELLQAYIDGAYFNLTDSANNYWSATSASSTNSHSVNLGNGATGIVLKTTSANMYIRCVR
jgi:prepilin-type N-terminal cleavage/methylation domain-containing protein